MSTGNAGTVGWIKVTRNGFNVDICKRDAVSRRSNVRTTESRDETGLFIPVTAGVVGTSSQGGGTGVAGRAVGRRGALQSRSVSRGHHPVDSHRRIPAADTTDQRAAATAAVLRESKLSHRSSAAAQQQSDFARDPTRESRGRRGGIHRRRARRMSDGAKCVQR